MPSSFAHPGVLRRFTRPAVTRAAYGAREALAVARQRARLMSRLCMNWVTGEIMLPEVRPPRRRRALLWNASIAAPVGAMRAARTDGQGQSPDSSFCLAYPRLDELTIEEMAALVRAFCLRFTDCGLAVQWDISSSSGRCCADCRARPCPLLGRPVRGDQILLRRERRFDTVFRPGARISYGWSREWRMHQEGFFAEHGITLAVAVPIGTGEIPMGRSRFTSLAKKRCRNCARNAARNCAIRPC